MAFSVSSSGPLRYPCGITILNMKIALAQINTQIGNLDGNVRKISDILRRAKLKKADLVVFPELTITGYPPKDLLEKPHFIDANLRALEKVVVQTKEIAAIVGFAEPNLEKQGKPIFNSAAMISEGKIQSIKRKVLLPTYDVFDEARYFQPGLESPVWNFSKMKIGLSVCEDIWGDESFWGRKIYPIDPILEQANQHPDLLINISASPYSMGKGEIRNALLKKTALKYKTPLVYLNLIGGNDDLIFDGSSFVLDATGNLCLKMKSFAEDFQMIDTDQLSPKSFKEEKEIALVRKALVLGTRDYMKKCRFKKAVIGLSGGIDSSLVALIAAEACGSENVLGISLPSPFSSQSSVEDAKKLAKKLKIKYQTISIDKIFDSYLKTLKWKLNRKKVDVATQNIQARIRGNLLMAHANREGSLLLSTGNKSELSVGYCTLYGDMAGGLAVISDLPKTLVYQLAREMNQKYQAIPESVFIKAPSAELAPNQKDEDDLPPYEVLDEILKKYIEENQAVDQSAEAGYSKKLIQNVIRKVDQNEYKREQSPPGLRVTSKAFGYGRRFPLTHGYQE